MSALTRNNLGLHGMGTNADIFRAQTASFRSILPSHYTFHFPEGEYEYPAADGIAEIYPGPYLCWYPFPPTLENVSEAHELIWNIIEEDGPFDGVMGFSQGAGKSCYYV
jgi:Serine hydrolase (FSH1)